MDLQSGNKDGNLGLRQGNYPAGFLPKTRTQERLQAGSGMKIIQQFGKNFYNLVQWLEENFYVVALSYLLLCVVVVAALIRIV